MAWTSQHDYTNCLSCDTKRYVQCIAAAPSFPALRQFPQGRRFKQWTGNDSKALMKVSMHVIMSPLLKQVYTRRVYLEVEAWSLLQLSDLGLDSVRKTCLMLKQSQRFPSWAS